MDPDSLSPCLSVATALDRPMSSGHRSTGRGGRDTGHRLTRGDIDGNDTGEQTEPR